MEVSVTFISLHPWIHLWNKWSFWKCWSLWCNVTNVTSCPMRKLKGLNQLHLLWFWTHWQQVQPRPRPLGNWGFTGGRHRWVLSWSSHNLSLHSGHLETFYFTSLPDSPGGRVKNCNRHCKMVELQVSCWTTRRGSEKIIRLTPADQETLTTKCEKVLTRYVMDPPPTHTHRLDGSAANVNGFFIVSFWQNH